MKEPDPETDFPGTPGPSSLLPPSASGFRKTMIPDLGKLRHDDEDDVWEADAELKQWVKALPLPAKYNDKVRQICEDREFLTLDDIKNQEETFVRLMVEENNFGSAMKPTSEMKLNDAVKKMLKEHSQKDAFSGAASSLLPEAVEPSSSSLAGATATGSASDVGGTTAPPAAAARRNTTLGFGGTTVAAASSSSDIQHATAGTLFSPRQMAAKTVKDARKRHTTINIGGITAEKLTAAATAAATSADVGRATSATATDYINSRRRNTGNIIADATIEKDRKSIIGATIEKVTAKSTHVDFPKENIPPVSTNPSDSNLDDYLKESLEGVEQEMMVMMLDQLQRCATACASVCERRVQHLYAALQGSGSSELSGRSNAPGCDLTSEVSGPKQQLFSVDDLVNDVKFSDAKAKKEKEMVNDVTSLAAELGHSDVTCPHYTLDGADETADSSSSDNDDGYGGRRDSVDIDDQVSQTVQQAMAKFESCSEAADADSEIVVEAKRQSIAKVPSVGFANRLSTLSSRQSFDGEPPLPSELDEMDRREHAKSLVRMKMEALKASRAFGKKNSASEERMSVSSAESRPRTKSILMGPNHHHDGEKEKKRVSFVGFEGLSHGNHHGADSDSDGDSSDSNHSADSPRGRTSVFSAKLSDGSRQKSFWGGSDGSLLNF